MSTNADRVVRSMTDDGSFRVITARTDATVGDAIAAQNASGKSAAILAQLLTGSILFRETMAPTLRVQCILDGTEPGTRFVADSHPDGGARGLVIVPDGTEEPQLGDRALLRMSRALPYGKLHEGVVRVPPSGTISDALMACLQESEQVVAVIAVEAITVDAHTRAGGYLVQLLPGVDRAMLSVMTERLETFPPLSELLARDTGPRRLADELLFRMPFTTLDESELRFRCRCSRERAEVALRDFAREEVERAQDEDRTLESRCEFCNVLYRFELSELEDLLGGPMIH